MNFALTLLFFPGLLFLLVLTLALRVIIERDGPFGRVRVPGLGLESAVAALSVLLAAAGLALLPWPLRPLQPQELAPNPLIPWLAFEGAFLLPMLPGLLSPDPLVNRTAVRELQISVAGRVVLWLALGTLLWQRDAWAINQLPGQVLLAAAALLALPAAISFGPFAGERGLTPSAAEHGLDQATSGFVEFARQARGAAVFAALLLALVPRAQIREPLALVVWAALAVVLALVLRRFNGRVPRLTLPSALRWCWTRALPIAVVGILYLAVVR